MCGRLQQWFGGAGPRLESDTEGAQASGALRHLDRPLMGRRSFVRLGGRQGAARVVSWLLPAAAAVESWDPGDTAPFHRPADFEQAPHPYQAVFTAAVTALPWKSATTLPFRVREIDDACTTCLACGQRCPTGALAASEAVGERGLFFDRARCTDCGLCERLCPHGAISTRAPTSITEIGNGRAPPLLRAARPCRRCAQQTEVARLVDGVCPQCDNEQGMDEQWMAMLDG